MFVPKEQYEKLKQKGEYLLPDTAVEMVPVPIKGWDAISPLAAMEPSYANIMNNWVPRTGWIELRGGYNPWVQGLSSNSAVESLMCYRPANASEKLFAASGSVIYDISTQGLPVSSNTGFSSDKFQYVNFTPFLGSNYLLIVNGSDPYSAFNGSVWSQPSVTGVSSNLLIHINIFKRRVWFTQENTTTFWFLGADAIQGAATAFDVGALWTKGGSAMAMATWTVDGGNGPDDYAVFISTRGQLAIYKGTDPTNANAFALIGVFDVGSPIGRRCFVRLGADILLITLDGLIPLSQTLPFDPVASRNVAITNRIQNAMISATFNFSANFGWQCIAFHQQSLLIFNIPQVQNTTSVQFVMNTITGAWTQFTGWNANCFEVFNESLYFGDSKGSVHLAYTGGLDAITPINADMRCAFNYFNQPGRLKHMTMVRPFLVADGSLAPTVQVDADFATTSVGAPITLLQPTGALWDVALWDVGLWAGGSVTAINWLSANAIGTTLAIRLKVNIVAGGTVGQAQSTSAFDIGLFDTMLFDGNGQITQSGNGIPILQVNAFETVLKHGGPI